MNKKVILFCNKRALVTEWKDVKTEINILVNTTTASLLVVIAVAMGVTNVTALSPYQSGYNHGVGDAQKAAHGLGGNDWYITQPGKGFAFHTPEFNRGYVDGFCSIAGSGSGSDANQGTFECP